MRMLGKLGYLSRASAVPLPYFCSTWVVPQIHVHQSLQNPEDESFTMCPHTNKPGQPFRFSTVPRYSPAKVVAESAHS